MYAKRADANQAEIVQAARQAGIAVLLLWRVGGGVPDLLTYYRQVYRLVEVKMPGEDLRAMEYEWHQKWPGPTYVVRTIEEMLEVHGVEAIGA